MVTVIKVTSCRLMGVNRQMRKLWETKLLPILFKCTYYFHKKISISHLLPPNYTTGNWDFPVGAKPTGILQNRQGNKKPIEKFTTGIAAQGNKICLLGHRQKQFSCQFVTHRKIGTHQVYVFSPVTGNRQENTHQTTIKSVPCPSGIVETMHPQPQKFKSTI